MRIAALVAVSLCAATAVTACAGDPPVTAGDYCQMVSANLDKLNAPAIADASAITASADLYRSITSIAPLAVQKEWQTMTSVVEAAAAVDPNDPAALQKVVDMTRSSQHAASTISDYTASVCGVTIVTPTTTTIAVIDTSVTTP